MKQSVYLHGESVIIDKESHAFKWRVIGNLVHWNSAEDSVLETLQVISYGDTQQEAYIDFACAVQRKTKDLMKCINTTTRSNK